MKKVALLCLVCMIATLAACSSVGPTAEQLKAMEGTSSSICVETPGWNGAAIKMHYSSFGGKSTGTAGGGGKATCGSSTVEFANEGRAINTGKTTVTPATSTAPATITVPVTVVPQVQ